METRKDLGTREKPGAGALARHDDDGEHDVVWVHLCSGKVVEVRPANAVRLEADRLFVLAGETEVTSFPRDQVYYTCHNGDACPVLD